MNIENYSDQVATLGPGQAKASKAAPTDLKSKFDISAADLPTDNSRPMGDDDSITKQDSRWQGNSGGNTQKKGRRTQSNGTKSSTVFNSNNEPVARAPVNLKRIIENKKGSKRDGPSQSRNKSKNAKKTQVQPKQKKNRLKSAAQNRAGIDLGNQANVHTIRNESNQDIQLGNFFNVNQMQEPPQLARMTENGQGFFDPTDFQVRKFEMAQEAQEMKRMKDYRQYQEQQRLISQQNMDHYGFYDEPRNPKIQNDWGEMFNVTNGMLSPDSAMRAHFEQNIALEMPQNFASPEKRKQHLEKLRLQQLNYKQGVVDSFCPDPQVQKELQTMQQEEQQQPVQPSGQSAKMSKSPTNGSVRFSNQMSSNNHRNQISQSQSQAVIDEVPTKRSVLANQDTMKSYQLKSEEMQEIYDKSSNQYTIGLMDKVANKVEVNQNQEEIVVPVDKIAKSKVELKQQFSSAGRSSAMSSMESLFTQMRGELTKKERKQIKRNNTKLYFTVLKNICRRRKELFNKYRQVHTLRKVRFWKIWQRRLSTINKQMILNLAYNKNLRKECFQMWVQAYQNKLKIEKAMKFWWNTNSYKVLATLKKHVDQQQEFVSTRDRMRYTKMRNLCFKILKEKTTKRKLNLIFYAQKREQQLMKIFIKQVQIEINESRLEKARQEALEEEKKAKEDADQGSPDQVQEIKIYDDIGLLQKGSNQNDAAKSLSARSSNKSLKQAVNQVNSQQQQTLIPANEDDYEMYAQKPKELSTMKTVSQHFDQGINKIQSPQMVSSNIMSYNNISEEAQPRPETIIPTVSAFFKLVKVNSEQHHSEFESKASPKPLELPLQTALIKENEQYSYDREHQEQQLTQKSNQLPSEVSFMDKIPESNRFSQPDIESEEESDPISKIEITLPHATSYYRKVKKMAILKPDLEWNEDDHLIIVDIPRMGAILGQMDDQVIEIDDTELIFFNEQIQHQQPSLTITQRSLEDSLHKESSQENVSIIENDEADLFEEQDAESIKGNKGVVQILEGIDQDQNSQQIDEDNKGLVNDDDQQANDALLIEENAKESQKDEMQKSEYAEENPQIDNIALQSALVDHLQQDEDMYMGAQAQQNEFENSEKRVQSDKSNKSQQSKQASQRISMKQSAVKSASKSNNQSARITDAQQSARITDAQQSARIPEIQQSPRTQEGKQSLGAQQEQQSVMQSIKQSGRQSNQNNASSNQQPTKSDKEEGQVAPPAVENDYDNSFIKIETDQLHNQLGRNTVNNIHSDRLQNQVRKNDLLEIENNQIDEIIQSPIETTGNKKNEQIHRQLIQNDGNFEEEMTTNQQLNTNVEHDGGEVNNSAGPLNQEIHFSNKENSALENEIKSRNSQTSEEDRSQFEERCMLKRQILAQGLEQYNISPNWFKDEHLDQMDVEQFQRHCDKNIYANYPFPCDEQTLAEFVINFLNNVQQEFEEIDMEEVRRESQKQAQQQAQMNQEAINQVPPNQHNKDQDIKSHLYEQSDKDDASDGSANNLVPPNDQSHNRQAQSGVRSSLMAENPNLLTAQAPNQINEVQSQQQASNQWPDDELNQAAPQNPQIQTQTRTSEGQPPTLENLRQSRQNDLSDRQVQLQRQSVENIGTGSSLVDIRGEVQSVRDKNITVDEKKVNDVGLNDNKTVNNNTANPFNISQNDKYQKGGDELTAQSQILKSSLIDEEKGLLLDKKETAIFKNSDTKNDILKSKVPDVDPITKNPQLPNQNPSEPNKKDDGSHKGEDHPCNCGEKDQPDQQPVMKQEEEFIQDLSYSALMKFIEANHPVHPITKKPFNIGDRVEVKQFFIKLLDPCGLNKMIIECIRCLKSYKKYALKGGCFQKNDDNQVKPEPNKLERSGDEDEDSSFEEDKGSESEDSSFEDEGGFGGLDAAGANIGNGAGLYLQMMKTFTFLFFVLSLINLPIYNLYQGVTRSNNYLDLGLSYLTLGNLAQANPACSHEKIIPITSSEKSITLSCFGETEYLQSITDYGVLYLFDLQMNQKSDGAKKCQQIQNYQKVSQLSAAGRILEEIQPNISAYQSFKQPHRSLQELKLNRINVTQFNFDSECRLASPTFFKKDQETKKEIKKYFRENCYGKKECKISTSIFTDALSDQCIERSTDNSISSNELVFVAGCKTDTLNFFGEQMHKQAIGFYVIIFDVASTLFIIHIFRRLHIISVEYCNTVDGHEITMSDFAVMCQGIHLDKHTQHVTLIKMRVWLHFHEQLKMADDKKYGKLQNDKKLEQKLKKIRGDDSKVLDVQLSIATQPKIIQIKQMEATQTQINTIKSKLQAGEYMNAEFFQKQEELEDLNEQFEVQKEKYQFICEEERKFIKSKTSLVNRSNRIDKIDYIFITFKHSATSDKAIDFCQKEPGASKFLRILFCLKDKVLDSKQFRGREIAIKRSVEPDEVQWSNLSYKGTGTLWYTITQLVSLIVFALLLIATIIVEGQKRTIQVDNPAIRCPDVNIRKEEAYNDVSNGKIATGLMECYCLQRFKSEPWGVPNLKFSDVDPNGLDEHEYCKDWAYGHFYRLFLVIISATLVIIFNSMTSKLFQILSIRQRLHTTKQTIKASFIQNLIVEFINMGLMLLIVSLTDLHTLFMSDTAKKDPDASRKYPGLIPQWYDEIGSVINITLILNIFFRNFIDMYCFAKAQYAQMSDRGFKSNLQKFPDDPDDDEPNTKKLVQEDLYTLYEGEELQADKNLSRMMSTLSVVLLYSSSMPFVYFIGFIFFIMTYQLNKLMLFRYYKRTDSQLNSSLPMDCIDILKYVLFLKLLMGLGAFTQPQIWITKDEPSPNSFVIFLRIDLKGYMNQFGLQTSDDPDQQVINPLDYLQLIHQQWYFYFSVGLILLYIFQKVIINVMVVIMTAAGNAIMSCITSIKRCVLKCFFFNSACIRNTINSIIENCKNCMKKGQKIGTKQAETELDEQEDDKIERIGIISGAKQEANEKIAKEVQQELMQEFEKEKESREQGFSENVIQEFDMENLRGFYLRSKREQLDFWAFFGINDTTREYIIPVDNVGPRPSKILDNFEEHCLRNKVQPQEVYKYDDLLSERIKEIEIVIEEHFQLIKEVIEEEKLEKRERDIEKTFGKEDYRQKIERLIIEANFEKDPDRQYSNRQIYTYEKMLQQLCDHQVQLIRQHKDHHPTSSGICRMKGQTQSYFIFDAQNSKVARKIYYAMEAEEDEYRKEHELDDIMFSSEDENESMQSSPLSGADNQNHPLGGLLNLKQNQP